MQVIPRYLVTNKTVLVINDYGTVTEYRKVYEKNQTVYKGINNTLTFEVKNGDQKPVDISSYTPRMIAYDQDRQVVLDVNGTLKLLTGQFTVSVTAETLDDVQAQYLQYIVTLTPDDSSPEVLTYADAQYDAEGTLEIKETYTSS